MAIILVVLSSMQNLWVMTSQQQATNNRINFDLFYTPSVAMLLSAGDVRRYAENDFHSVVTNVLLLSHVMEH